MKKIQGFTLIELMVTIAVLAIIAMMAAPTFGDMLDKQNLNRSTQNLLGLLQQARAQAILERRDVTVDLSKTTQTANIATTLYWLPQGNSIFKTGSPQSVTFMLSGGVKDYDATVKDKPFVICNKNSTKSKEVSLSLMGTTQLKEGTCS